MRSRSVAVRLAVLALFSAPSALAQMAPAGSPPAEPAPGSTATPLSAGGLAPPPAVEAPPAAQPESPGSASTEAALERADREDSGRGLQFVWLNAEVGVTHVGLRTFKDNDLVDPTAVKTAETGLVAGAGAGVRLIFLSLGARFRYAPLSDFKLWSLALEGGVHAPFGSLEPYATLALGYVSIGSFPGLGASVNVNGFDARLGGGLDYYLTNLFSIGANVSADLMLLQRNTSVCPSDVGAPAPSDVYCGSGSSIGGGLTGTVVGGLHF